MTSSPTISFVVPFFNAEKTISKTLESIHQALLRGGLNELISFVFVNNNSADNSRILVQDWIKRHEVDCILVDEFRQGVSSARNCGVRHSSGDFVAFIDADDAVDVCYFSEIFSAIDAGIDLLVLNPVNHFDNQILPAMQNDCYFDVVGCEALKFIDGWWNWRFIVRSDFLREWEFFGTCFEDFGVFPFLLQRANNVRLIKMPICIYQRNQESLTAHVNMETINQLKLQYERLVSVLKSGTPIFKRVNSDFFDLLTLFRSINGLIPVRSIRDLSLMVDYLTGNGFLRKFSTLAYRFASVLKRKFLF